MIILLKPEDYYTQRNNLRKPNSACSWERHANGIMKAWGTTVYNFSGGAATSGVTFPIAFATVPKFFHHPTSHIAGVGYLFAYQNLVATTTTNSQPGLALSSGTHTGLQYSDWEAIGPWR